MKPKKRRSFFNSLQWIVGAILATVFVYALTAEFLHSRRLPRGDYPVELYSTEMQDDLTAIISNAIDQAQTSVTLVIYTLSDPKIIHSLKVKSESEVIVKVICDSKTCPDIEHKLGDKVKILKRFMKGLMHIKLLIIDDKQTWIGSANMTRASLRHHGNLVAAIDSEPFAEMASAKARSFTSTERMHDITHRTFLIGNQNVELWFLPDDPTAISRIKQLIRSAQKSIRIAMFTWTRRDFAQEVVLAKKRGIKVEIVLDKNSAIGAGEEVTKILRQGGINPKLGGGTSLMHHKFIIIDDATLVNGSANWTLAAFDKNDDCFLVLNPLLSAQQNLLNGTWKALWNDAMDMR